MIERIYNMKLLKDCLKSKEFNKKELFVCNKNYELIAHGNKKLLKRACKHKLQNARIDYTLDYGNAFYFFIEFISPLKLGDFLLDHPNHFVRIYNYNGQVVTNGKGLDILKTIGVILYNKQIVSLDKDSNIAFIFINL